MGNGHIVIEKQILEALNTDVGDGHTVMEKQILEARKHRCGKQSYSHGEVDLEVIIKQRCRKRSYGHGEVDFRSSATCC